MNRAGRRSARSGAPRLGHRQQDHKGRAEIGLWPRQAPKPGAGTQRRAARRRRGGSATEACALRIGAQGRTDARPQARLTHSAARFAGRSSTFIHPGCRRSKALVGIDR